MSTETGPAAKPTILAIFHPQAWISNNAIDADPEGETEWDCTADILAMGRKVALAMKDNNDSREHGSDHLRELASAPTWIRNWGGPFWVEIEESIAAFVAAGGVISEEPVGFLRVGLEILGPEAPAPAATTPQEPAQPLIVRNADVGAEMVKHGGDRFRDRDAVDRIQNACEDIDNPGDGETTERIVVRLAVFLHDRATKQAQSIPAPGTIRELSPAEDALYKLGKRYMLDDLEGWLTDTVLDVDKLVEWIAEQRAALTVEISKL